MKFKKYVKEQLITETCDDTTQETLNEFMGNPDAPTFVQQEMDAIYGPVHKLIADGKYDEARKEIEDLQKDLDEVIAANEKRKIFKYPKFMLSGQQKNIDALKAKLAKLTESVYDMDKRCDVCNTLLNDGGTCPKCDDGEEDYEGSDEPIAEVNEELSVREKLKRAYPELNFDNDAVTESVVEDLSNKEKLKRAYPELNFGSTESDNTVTEELSNKEKLKRAYPELNFESNVDSNNIVTESTEDNQYSDYDDDYEVDDAEQDRVHAALYGGDRMYCDCGAKLSMNEWGSYCPVCDAEEVITQKQSDMYIDDDM